jgi:hypothetical protein
VDASRVFDDQLLSVGEDRRRDVAASESFADEIVFGIEFDETVGIHAPYERYAAACQGQMQPPVFISVGGEGERGGQGPPLCAMVLKPRAGIASPVFGHPEGTVGFAEVVVAQKGGVDPPERAQIGTVVAQHPFLPEGVEALDVGVAAWFPRRSGGVDSRCLGGREVYDVLAVR